MDPSFHNYALLQANLVEAIDQQADEVDNVLELDWSHKPAQARANQLAKVLGEPFRYNSSPGGVAIWKYVDPFFQQANGYEEPAMNPAMKPTDVYAQLMIKDEAIPHLVPVPHNDWFYAYIYIDIPTDKVADVSALTESVGYDTMKKELYARCHFMPANLVSLYLAKQIAQGHKSLAHAQQEYVVLIPILAKEEKAGKGLMTDTMGPWHTALTRYTFSLK
jgi:hypothetical protein